MNLIIYSFLLGLINWIILKKLNPLLSKNFLDNPNERSSHLKPIPSGGGISFVIVSCTACAFSGFWLPLECLPLSIIGFLDDYFGISALIRYFFQIITVYYILLNSTLVNNYFYLFNQFEYILIFLLMLIIGTAIINFINFMDGLDGFLISNIIIIFLTTSILFNQYILLLVGPLVGFSILNWQPAKVFMGDVGSTFLGAVFFGLLVNRYSINESFLILSMGFPILADAFICVIRRFFAGQNIFKPHKLHLYQRLSQKWLSHKKVVYFYGIATLAICFFSIINFKLLIFSLFAFLFFGIYLDRKIAVPFDNKNEMFER